MLSKLPMVWQILAVVTVITMSYPLSLMFDALLGSGRFGTVTSMSVISIGFFATLYGAEHYRYAIYGMQHAIIVGTIGAIVLMVLLAALKAIFARL